MGVGLRAGDGFAGGQEPADILRDGPARAGSRRSARAACNPAPPTSPASCPRSRLASPPASARRRRTDEAKLAPAWTLAAAPDPLRLPVYYSWEFATGPEASFESLVRRIQPRPLPPESTHPARLDLSAAGGGLPPLDPATAGVVVDVESAMRLPGPDAPPWPDDGRIPFQQALAGVLGTPPGATLTPPLYGQVQAGVAQLPADGEQPSWLRELNLDPRLRAAAAAGTRVVQDRQEELMASAWEQAGAVRQTNARLRQAQLARELGGVLFERHLQPLAPAELLAVTGPAHASIAMSPQTLADELRESRLPDAVVSGAFRRLASPQGALLRRAVPSEDQRGQLDVLPAVDGLAWRRRRRPRSGWSPSRTPHRLPRRATSAPPSRRSPCRPGCSTGSPRGHRRLARADVRRRPPDTWNRDRIRWRRLHRRPSSQSRCTAGSGMSRRSCSSPASTTSRPIPLRCSRRRRA